MLLDVSEEHVCVGCWNNTEHSNLHYINLLGWNFIYTYLV